MPVIDQEWTVTEPYMDNYAYEKRRDEQTRCITIEMYHLGENEFE